METSHLIGCHIDSSVAEDVAKAFSDRIERHAKGKMLVCQGDDADGIYYIVLSGEVKLSSISTEGKDFAHFICVAPSVFGETAFASNVREFFAEALTDVTLLKLHVSEHFDSSSLEIRFLRELVKNICTKDLTKRRITQPYRGASLKKILLGIMKDMSKAGSPHSKKTQRNGRLCYELNCTQQIISQFAQASRINVSKALAELAEEGIIDVDKRKIYYYSEQEQ